MLVQCHDDGTIIEIEAFKITASNGGMQKNTRSIKFASIQYFCF